MSEECGDPATNPVIDKREPALTTSGILLMAALVTVGSGVYQGTFSYQGLVLLVAALGWGVWMHLRPVRGLPAPEMLLVGMLLAFLVAGCLLSSGQNEIWLEGRLPGLGRVIRRLNWYGIAIKLLSAAALLLALTFVARMDPRGRLAKRRFVLLVALAASQYVLILFSAPRPQTDVFVSQTEGAQGLFEGRNVYSMTFTPSYEGEVADHYGYPPAAFYPVAAAWRLFGDVRAAWVACQLLAVFFLYRLARRVHPERLRFARLLTLVFLFLPRGLLVVEQSWTEPLVLASMGAFALAWASGVGSAGSGALLGLWLSSKQYAVLAVPFLLKLAWRRVNLWLWAVAVGALLALPFALWDFQSLMDDVLLFFFSSEGRADALSLYGALLRHGIALRWAVVTPLWLGGLAFFTWRTRRDLAGLLFGTASMWLYFFLLGKQAFMNYYHVVIYALLLSAAATLWPESEGKVE